MIDLLVIGAGLSGLMAAITAAQQGMRVRIVTTGLGSLHWTPGTIGVLGYLPGEKAPVKKPYEALDPLIQLRPGHPYALVGRGVLDKSLGAFGDIVQFFNLPYFHTPDYHNLLLPSPAGAPRPVFLAPEAQIDGDMGRAEPYVIVGFQALRDFYPTLIAENLTKLGLQARAEFLPIEYVTTRKDFSTVHLAQALDDPATATRLAEALTKVVRPGERVGLPAILGLKRHIETIITLRRALNAPLFEIPTLPPSVPGIRLMNSLRGVFEQLFFGRIELGMTVTDFSARHGRIEWVASRAGHRWVKHRAERFLLATGGILGGGFRSDFTGRVKEVVFDLPLDIPQQRSQWFRPDFLAAEGHPVFRGGVRVGPDFRPVDAKGRRLFDNLWAAGTLLADADPIAERSIEGIAIGTAFAAVQNMVEA